MYIYIIDTFKREEERGRIDSCFARDTSFCFTNDFAVLYGMKPPFLELLFFGF